MKKKQTPVQVKVPDNWQKQYEGVPDNWTGDVPIGVRLPDKLVTIGDKLDKLDKSIKKNLETMKMNGWDTPAAQEVIKEQLRASRVTEPSEPQQLLLAVYREVWKDTVFQKCSHGLVVNIQEYLMRMKLIEQSPVNHE